MGTVFTRSAEVMGRIKVSLCADDLMASSTPQKGVCGGAFAGSFVSDRDPELDIGEAVFRTSVKKASPCPVGEVDVVIDIRFARFSCLCLIRKAAEGVESRSDILMVLQVASAVVRTSSWTKRCQMGTMAQTEVKCQ